MFSGQKNLIEYQRTRSKRHPGRNLFKVIKLFLFSIFATLLSCNGVAPNRASNSLNSSESSVNESPSESFEAKDPETGSFVNFFQINTKQYKANFEISEKEQRVFYLRGQEVSEYLKSVDRRNPACLSVVFTEETLKRFLFFQGLLKAILILLKEHLSTTTLLNPPTHKKIKVIAKPVTSLINVF